MAAVVAEIGGRAVASGMFGLVYLGLIIGVLPVIGGADHMLAAGFGLAAGLLLPRVVALPAVVMVTGMTVAMVVPADLYATRAGLPLLSNFTLTGLVAFGIAAATVGIAPAVATARRGRRAGLVAAFCVPYLMCGALTIVIEVTQTWLVALCAAALVAAGLALVLALPLRVSYIWWPSLNAVILATGLLLACVATAIAEAVSSVPDSIIVGTTGIVAFWTTFTAVAAVAAGLAVGRSAVRWTVSAAALGMFLSAGLVGMFQYARPLDPLTSTVPVIALSVAVGVLLPRLLPRMPWDLVAAAGLIALSTVMKSMSGTSSDRLLMVGLSAAALAAALGSALIRVSEAPVPGPALAAGIVVFAVGSLLAPWVRSATDYPGRTAAPLVLLPAIAVAVAAATLLPIPRRS